MLAKIKKRIYLSTFLGSNDVCYSDHLETTSHKDHMQCPHVVTNVTCTAQWQSGLKPFNYLPPVPSTPMGCVAFADRQVERDRLKPSTCSHTAYNYRPLPACLPCQPHPCVHMGSLPLTSPSGCWHSTGHAAQATVASYGRSEGEAMCTLWN